MRLRLLLLALLLCGALAALAWNRLGVSPAAEPHPRPPPQPKGAEAPRTPSIDPASLSRARHPSRVADEAGLLDMWVPRLTRMADAWHEDLGIDFHVATLGSPALPVEKLAPQVFALREIGGAAPNGGVLLLINPALGQARLEVSYGLEPVFPDALLGRIAADQLAPYAAYSSSGMAVMDVLHLLKDYAYLRALGGILELEPAYRQRPEYLEKARYLSGGGGAQLRLSDIPSDAEAKARVPEPRRSRYAPSADPLQSAEAFLRTRRDLVGDPTLELYTPGTRVMLSRYPFAPFEVLERLEKAEASRPLRAVAQGDRAVVTSDQPANGFIPILLHRTDGLWRVDTAETFKNLFFGRDGNYRLQNGNTPYAFGLGAFGSAPFQDLAAWDLGGYPLEAVIDRLEAGEDALSHFLLAEVLFRNCFVAVEALQHYERALELAPGAPLLRETLGDRLVYLGFPQAAALQYKQLRHHGYPKVAEAYLRSGDLEQAERFLRLALERDPYDQRLLGTLRLLLEQAGRRAQEADVAGELRAIERDDSRRSEPVELTFSPGQPELMLGEPILVGETPVYDHSLFSVAMTNRSGRPVEIEQVKLISAGTGDTSGLGDIKDYWSYPSGPHRLDPGESRSFSKTWGFTVDTANSQLSYVFDLCWRGVGESRRQCRSQRLDLFPR